MVQRLVIGYVGVHGDGVDGVHEGRGGGVHGAGLGGPAVSTILPVVQGVVLNQAAPSTLVCVWRGGGVVALFVVLASLGLFGG